MQRTHLVTALTPELACRDVQASLAFYVSLLGFTVQYQRPENGFAMLERQGSRLMLDQINIGRTWASGPLEPPLGRGINLQMQTTEVDQLYARVQAAGAPVFLPMEEKWYRCDATELGNRQFIVQDPDGYLLRFFQDLGARSVEAAL